jgi:excisionase family DNA binding protein
MPRRAALYAWVFERRCAAMTASTVLPPHDPDALADVRPASAPHPCPALVGPDGTAIPLPTEVYEALRGIVQALRCGNAVTIAVHGTELTTGEAAGLLGVSRPTLVKLLDSGKIPYTQPAGLHRRVQVADVMDYRNHRNQARSEGLAAMVEISEEFGLYDEDMPAPRR